MYTIGTFFQTGLAAYFWANWHKMTQFKCTSGLGLGMQCTSYLLRIVHSGPSAWHFLVLMSTSDWTCILLTEKQHAWINIRQNTQQQQQGCILAVFEHSLN